MLNTLAHILHVSKGSQSVLYDPTLVNLRRENHCGVMASSSPQILWNSNRTLE